MPTTANGLRYPSLSAAPNVPQDVQNLASDVDTVYGPLLRRGPYVCTSTTRPSSPATGLEIYETDLRCVRIWDGSAWRIHDYDRQTYAPAEDFEVANDTSTSQTYVPGTLHGVTFVAPPTGRVAIHFSGWVGSTAISGAGIYTYMSDYVRAGATLGSGTDVVTPSDDRALFFSLNNTAASGYKYVHDSANHQVTGLTPGASYNVVTVFRCTVASGATSAVNKRWLRVEPA
ncbi:hypothetical protein [Micromonospora echinospora]|uniref:hypothetical protein n=1 Tax=Micromonospora echinospora TaxID=1877 RepID=UPI003A8A3BCF